MPREPNAELASRAITLSQLEVHQVDRHFKSIKGRLARVSSQKKVYSMELHLFSNTYLVGITINNLTFEDTRRVYVVDRLMNQITIANKNTGKTCNGMMQDWENIMNQADEPGVAQSRHYCQHCGKTHTKYGMELEFVLFGRDADYKNVFLKKVNNKAGIDVMRDTVGLDGSRTPIEVRNINGDTPDEIYANLTAKMKEVADTYAWMKKNFPGVSSEINTKVCGIHVHVFHPGITRSRLVAAFTAVGLVVNDYNVEDWSERMKNNYGLPFAYRGSEWCSSEHATEFRMLNSLHPSVLHRALVCLEEVLDSNTGVGSDAGMQEFINKIGATARAPDFTPSAYHAKTKVVNESIAYLINKKAVKFTQIKRLVTWLRKNYRPFKDCILNNHGAQSVKPEKKKEFVI